MWVISSRPSLYETDIDLLGTYTTENDITRHPINSFSFIYRTYIYIYIENSYKCLTIAPAMIASESWYATRVGCWRHDDVTLTSRCYGDAWHARRRNYSLKTSHSRQHGLVWLWKLARRTHVTPRTCTSDLLASRRDSAGCRSRHVVLQSVAALLFPLFRLHYFTICAH